MKLEFKKQAFDDIKYWKKHNKNILEKIADLLDDIAVDPFEGIGKPEPLKYELSGCWSRRIDHKHRLIYKIDKTRIIVIRCRFHYK